MKYIITIITLAVMLLPQMAGAQNVAKNLKTETEYTTLRAALQAATNGQTVQLIANAVNEPTGSGLINNLSSGHIAINANSNSAKTITLDLNGYVYKTGVTDGCMIAVAGGSNEKTRTTLKIKDSRPDTPHYGKLAVHDSYKDDERWNGNPPMTWIWDDAITEEGEGILKVNGGIITGGYSTAGGDNVGILLKGYSTLELQGGNIIGNILNTERGGGCAIRMNSGTCRLNISGGSIAYNISTSNAGAVLGHGGVTMSGGEVHHNVAGNQGGAFRVPSNMANCFFTMTGGSIHDNRSGTDGGALNIGDGGGTNVTKGNVEVKISGGEIYNNHTDGMGGAICSVWRNYADNSYKMTVNISDNVKFYNNSASQGGAIYMAYGNLNMTGGEMYGNSVIPGNFSYTEGIKNSTEQKTIEVESTGEGGAIYAANGNVSIDGTAYLHDNSATGKGGAIFISPQASNRTDLKGGTIKNNSAGLGGGLCTDANGDAKGNCYLYNNLNLSDNTIENSSPVAGSDLATVSADAYFTLAEDVNYGNICVQRGTAGNMIKLNNHSYNNYKARPDITLTGEGANGVLAVQDLEWVNVVNMIRDNETQNGGYSVNPDSPDRLLTDSRFAWTGDDATKTTTETYGMAYSRTDRPNRYGTVMLPFAATIMDNVTLYEIVSIEQGILSLHEVKEPERNKPYIYKIENADDESAEPKNYSMHLATNKNTQLAETELSASEFKYFPDNSRYQFIGKYTLEREIPTNGDYDIYYFKNDGTTSGFYHKSAGTITVNPYRGYITLKKDLASPAPPRMLALSFDDEATGIGCMQVNMADIVRTEYFSTDGTRLAAPLSHGITIIRHHYSDGTSDTRKVRGI
ncbi:MAG: hypothetical protein KBT33_04005 [Prevotellaceae bacterium]|nr:hypothetical protein [Candidatus Minthosoma equi]